MVTDNPLLSKQKLIEKPICKAGSKREILCTYGKKVREPETLQTRGLAASSPPENI